MPMNKKTIILLTILIAIPLAYYFLKKDLNTNSTVNDDHFAISNLDDIDKIFISENKTKDFALLTKDPNNVWRINNRWVVNESRMRILLETFRDVRVKYEVPEEAKSTIMAQIAGTGVKTMIYNGNKLMKSYFVGTPTSDMLGTYIVESGSNNPIVVHIPGMNGFISSRYFTDSIEWRNKNIFNIPSRSISEIQVKWPNNPKNNYRIVNTDNDVKLMDNIGNEVTDINGLKLKSYLNLFMVHEKNNLACEGFHKNFSQSKVDSIANGKPFFEISVTQQNKSSKTLRLYRKPIQVNTYEAYDGGGNLLEYEQDKYWGVQDDENWIMEIQDLVFAKIMKKVTDFK
jgi:hypothetical protein